jgi:ferredoxin
MADRKNQVSENVSGKYFVDDQCIHCGICVSVAEANFKYNDEDAHAYVYKQPANEKEESDCLSVMETCPVNAIGAE